MLEPPATVRRKALVTGAQAWLDALPAWWTGLLDDWHLTPVRVLDGGTEALVAQVRRADGSPAVLKVLVDRPGGHADHEITGLRLADGDGCVAVLEADPGRGALLLELLGRPMSDLGLPLDDRLEILADLARAVWRPVAADGPGAGLPTGATKAALLSDHVATTWETLGRPCRAAAAEHALECADRRGRAHDDDRAVLVHGDVHQWNALEAPATGLRTRAVRGFALVDLDGLRAEPEYDLGVVLREDPGPVLAGEDPWPRVVRLAHRAGVDARAAWEWAVVERVSTGLVLASVDLQPVARDLLAAADVVATRFRDPA